MLRHRKTIEDATHWSPRYKKPVSIEERPVKPHKWGKGHHRWVTICLFMSLVKFFQQKIVLEQLDENQGEKKAEELLFTKSIPVRVPVFYNVYNNPTSNASLATSSTIIQEQISQLLPEHDLLVHSIGAPIKVVNATLLQHSNKGDEKVTLGLLWQHCKEHSSDTVVYIHNKGSFHPSKENDNLRRFITRGALSEECMNMPTSCNVCSSRMSPYPHPHTSGNMWVARCEYIQKLIDPLDFTLKMSSIYQTLYKGKSGSPQPPSCMGAVRFAAEHWVHSHPQVMPCDLSSNDYTWGYNNIPPNDFEMKLEPAPRYGLKIYEKVDKRGWCADERRGWNRLKEYEDLYQESVTESWWGWKLYAHFSRNSTATA